MPPSFKERFKDRNEVVGRDGANSIAARGVHHTNVQQQARAQAPPTVTSQSSVPSIYSSSNAQSVAMYGSPPLPQVAQYQQQPQQYPQQQPQYQQPQYQQPQYPQQQPQYQQQQPQYQQQPQQYPQQFSSQPSFFITGGGYPVVPPIGLNPFGATSIPPLPHIQSGTQSGGDLYSSVQYSSQPLQPVNAASPSPAKSRFVEPAPESPTSAPRRMKEPLPDFHTLSAMERDRRAGRARIERPPVLVDHPHGGQYHEHTLDEYKNVLAEYRKIHWGGLGPDDNEHKAAERAKRRKVFDYANQVNAVNFALMDVMLGDAWHNRPIEKKYTLDAQLAQIKRQRAMQYADAVKPPVVSARKAKTPQLVSPAKSPPPESKQQLETLEEKHKRDQEAIQRIKAQLNIIS